MAKKIKKLKKIKAQDIQDIKDARDLLLPYFEEFSAYPPEMQDQLRETSLYKNLITIKTAARRSQV